MTKKLAWAIVNKEGDFNLLSFGRTRNESISEFMMLDEWGHTWKEARLDGFRCIRVEIKPVQPKKKARRG